VGWADSLSGLPYVSRAPRAFSLWITASVPRWALRMRFELVVRACRTRVPSVVKRCWGCRSCRCRRSGPRRAGYDEPLLGAGPEVRALLDDAAVAGDGGIGARGELVVGVIEPSMGGAELQQRIGLDGHDLLIGGSQLLGRGRADGSGWTGTGLVGEFDPASSVRPSRDSTAGRIRRRPDWFAPRSAEAHETRIDRP